MKGCLGFPISYVETALCITIETYIDKYIPLKQQYVILWDTGSDVYYIRDMVATFDYIYM